MDKEAWSSEISSPEPFEGNFFIRKITKTSVTVLVWLVSLYGWFLEIEMCYVSLSYWFQSLKLECHIVNFGIYGVKCESIIIKSGCLYCNNHHIQESKASYKQSMPQSQRWKSVVQFSIYLLHLLIIPPCFPALSNIQSYTTLV